MFLSLPHKDSRQEYKYLPISSVLSHYKSINTEEDAKHPQEPKYTEPKHPELKHE